MVDRELNRQLFLKAKEELSVLRQKLLAMPKDEMLECAFEYSTKVDIMYSFDSDDIPVEKASKLLALDTPLADVYELWVETESRYYDEIRKTIVELANGLPEPKSKHKSYDER